jgi:hypothetical protein
MGLRSTKVSVSFTFTVHEWYPLKGVVCCRDWDGGRKHDINLVGKRLNRCIVLFLNRVQIDGLFSPGMPLFLL